MRYVNFKRKEKVPFHVWVIVAPLPKPCLPIKLIRNFYKIRKDLPERVNLFIPPLNRLNKLFP